MSAKNPNKPPTPKQFAKKKANQKQRKESLRDSPILAQLEEIMLSMTGQVQKACQAAGVHSKTVQRWLKGETRPTLQDVEKLLGVLGYVCICIPYAEAPCGSTVRDLLPLMDRAIYDAQSGDPGDALCNSLRLIQMKQMRLEEEWLMGTIDGDTYRKEFHRLQQDLCFTSGAIAKIQEATAFTGWGDDVEEVQLIHGSAKAHDYASYQRKLKAAEEKRLLAASTGQDRKSTSPG